MKNILLKSLFIIGVASLAIFGTQAFFSDTETSQNNSLQAGKIDLQIDNASYYNGMPSEGTTWELDDLTDHLFFNFTDLKPDDYGEDTISIHVDDNDAWACMKITQAKDDDNTCTEPELLDDLNGCSEPDDNLFDGELGDLLYFVFWADDGDNVLETGEDPTWRKRPASSLFDGSVWPLADSTTNIWTGVPGPILASDTKYIGKFWCFGTLQPQPRPVADYPQGPAGDNNGNGTVGEPEDGGFTCNGTAINNATQSDLFMADVEFSAYQHRHNPNFLCDGQTPSVSPSVSPSITVSPTPRLACAQADVMLVLDRSGSISSIDPDAGGPLLSELQSLKDAANTFVADLGLSVSGVHAGMTSFANTGALNVHLTSTASDLTTAINAMVSGGFTNLNEGLSLARGEHTNPGDGHDRVDGSSPDKVIVITDGQPNRPLPSDTADDLALATANAYKADGAEIFVVGVGSDVNSVYLQTIATDAAHYYPVTNYSGLQTLLQGLDLCQ